MLPIPSFTHDLELLVYCSTELIFQVNVPMFETEVMNYIKATFTTSEVIEVISHLSTIADLVEFDPIDVPFAKMTKTAPGSWQITLAGNDTILRELLGTIYQNGKYTEDRNKTLKMAKREWASCSASSSFSSLQLTSPASLDEVTPYMGYESSSRDPQVETEIIQLSQSKVTYIIGTGGERIEEIRRLTGCLIKIPALPQAQRKVMDALPRNEASQEVFLEGTSVQLAEAKSMIRRLLADHKQGYRSERRCTHSHFEANASNMGQTKGEV